jgi:hypothetical protein
VKLFELLFVLALVLGWGGYELWTLRRDEGRTDDDDRAAARDGDRAAARGED